jgi:hypothetical protein
VAGVSVSVSGVWWTLLRLTHLVGAVAPGRYMQLGGAKAPTSSCAKSAGEPMPAAEETRRPQSAERARTGGAKSPQQGSYPDLLAVTRALDRLPFLGPIFALGWPLDDPGGPRNQLKKSPKAGSSA